MSFSKDEYEILLYFNFYRLLVDYAHKVKEIMSFNKDNYKILLYFNFYILLVANSTVEFISFFFRQIIILQFLYIVSR